MRPVPRSSLPTSRRLEAAVALQKGSRRTSLDSSILAREAVLAPVTTATSECSEYLDR